MTASKSEAECGRMRKGHSDANSACLTTDTTDPLLPHIPPPVDLALDSTPPLSSFVHSPLHIPLYLILSPPHLPTIIINHATGSAGLSSSFTCVFLSAHTTFKPNASTSHMMKTTKRGRPFLKVFPSPNPPGSTSFPRIHHRTPFTSHDRTRSTFLPL